MANNLELCFASMSALLIEAGLWREIVLGNGPDAEYHYDVPASLKDLAFSSLCYDSRTASPGSLFFCKGEGYKDEYLAAALEKGAAAYVSQEIRAGQGSVPGIIVSDVQKALASLSGAYYRYPAKKLFIIAITGTKGKTTTAYFCKHILDYFNGTKTALVSTLDYTVDGKTFAKSHLTTPESLDLAALMYGMVEQGMTHLVLEVSSQAWKKSRVWGLDFDVTVFLNISPDHVGTAEHPNFEDYFYCKRQILSRGRTLVINRETAHFDCVFEHAKSLGKPVVCFDAKDGARYNSRLPGNFNVSNVAAARAACLLAGASEDDCRRGIEETRVPGRMESFQRKGGGRVYVDYAHNGESLEQVMRFVHSTQGTDRSRLAVVIGATGNKGQSRRKDFARVLDALGDVVVITADDPDREDPEAIMAEIAREMHNPAVTMHQEADRTAAIRQAFALTPGTEDAVLVAGKGADAFQRVNGVLTPYAGDIAVVQRFIAEGA